MDTSSLFRLDGRVALVTGGSRGIGKMIAAGFIAQGAKVYISSRKAAVCLEAAAELGPNCIALPQDVSTVAGCQALAAQLAQHETRLDILVNNAGAAWGAPFDAFPESGWDKVMDLNVKSVFFLTQKLLPNLAAAASPDHMARVVNIGSIDGQHVSDLETYSYAASKAGVLHLTRMMAKFLGPRHIAVNAIAPGFFPSKMTAAIAEEFREAFRAATPMQRWGNADDMAGVALFLASRASGFMTGSVITVDGGYATTV
jgi:NAD(P)-dependent dehydrogenase (short-subunit alcohol dehydrogenase family)